MSVSSVCDLIPRDCSIKIPCTGFRNVMIIPTYVTWPSGTRTDIVNSGQEGTPNPGHFQDSMVFVEPLGCPTPEVASGCPIWWLRYTCFRHVPLSNPRCLCIFLCIEISTK